MDIDEAIKHPDMLAYQYKVIEKQIDLPNAGKALAGQGFDNGDKPKDKEREMSLEEIRARAHIVPSVVGNIKGHELDPKTYPQFIEWLKKEYETVENLVHCWNGDGQQPGLWGKITEWKTWDDVLNGLDNGPHNKDYRHFRDMMRFRADTFIDSAIKTRIDLQKITDPNVPLRSGGEMGLFLPFASRGTDMEGIGRAMAEGSSFYPSIHLTWHFEECEI